MATIFRCDGCEKDFTNRGNLRTIEIPYMTTQNQEFSEDEGSFTKDLCDRCWRKILQTVEQLKIK